jgi:hypothetical protein
MVPRQEALSFFPAAALQKIAQEFPSGACPGTLDEQVTSL